MVVEIEIPVALYYLEPYKVDFRVVPELYSAVVPSEFSESS